MINEYFKVSDTDESVLDMGRNYHRPEISKNLCYRQLQHSEQPRPLLSLKVQDTVHTSAYRREIVRSISLLVKDNLNPPLALLQPRESLRPYENKQWR